MYYIIEIQENNGTPAVLTQTSADKNTALSKFYNVLSYAANSKVEIHSCIIMDAYGKYIAQESFYHPITEDVNSVEGGDNE